MRFPFMRLSPAEERLLFKLIMGVVLLTAFAVAKLFMP